MNKRFTGNWAPIDIQPIKALFETLSSKNYSSGYLYLKHSQLHYNNDDNKGIFKVEHTYADNDKPSPEMILRAAESCGLTSMPRPSTAAKEGMWCKFWFEHTGLIMRMWSVPDDIAALPLAKIPSVQIVTEMELTPHKDIISLIKLISPDPFVLSIAQAEAKLISKKEAVNFISTQPPPLPYDSMFSIKPLKSSEIIFAAPCSIQANSWVVSIRLAIYELARLSEYFTLTIMKDPPFYRIWQDMHLSPFTNKLSKGSKPTKHTGLLEAMFGPSHEWKSYFAVVSTIEAPVEVTPPNITSTPPNGAETTAERKKENKKLFRTSKDYMAVPRGGSQSLVHFGQLLLYDKKTDTKPVKIIEQIRESYLVWPSTAVMGDLSNGANLMRVEGVVVDAIDHNDDKAGSIDTSVRPGSDKPKPMRASQILLGTKLETFYLRFADSWAACHWNALFMVHFHVDGDLYERDRQVRAGEIGIADNFESSMNDTASPPTSPRPSFVSRNSLPTIPTTQVNSRRRSNIDKFKGTGADNGKNNAEDQNDAIELLEVLPSGTSGLSPDFECSSTELPRIPSSMPNWMKSYSETRGPEFKWGLLYLGASEVFNLSMLDLSLYDAVREFGSTLQDKRKYYQHNNMAKWNNSVKKDRINREAAEVRQVGKKAFHLLTSLASQGVSVNLDSDNTVNDTSNRSSACQPIDDRPYGMATNNLHKSLACKNLKEAMIANNCINPDPDEITPSQQYQTQQSNVNKSTIPARRAKDGQIFIPKRQSGESLHLPRKSDEKAVFGSVNPETPFAKPNLSALSKESSLTFAAENNPKTTISMHNHPPRRKDSVSQADVAGVSLIRTGTTDSPLKVESQLITSKASPTNPSSSKPQAKINQPGGMNTNINLADVGTVQKLSTPSSHKAQCSSFGNGSAIIPNGGDNKTRESSNNPGKQNGNVPAISPSLMKPSLEVFQAFGQESDWSEMLHAVARGAVLQQEWDKNGGGELGEVGENGERFPASV